MSADDTVPTVAADAPADTDSSQGRVALSSRLEELEASATQQYSLKNYHAAAEFYSEAAEVQEQLNGEMSPANADLLYQYGRCLYHVAVSKSDVLGGKVASAEEPKRKKRKVAPAEASSSASATATATAGASGAVIGEALDDGEKKMQEEILEAVVEEKDSSIKEDDALASKPYFQITGDENWTDSEEEEEADEEAEEEEDDFATAYEILDMARVLLARKLEAVSETSTKAKQEQRQIKERLADTHDLQAEISLENERFHDAIKDTRDGLALKLELYPTESSLIAEAHFKLSLALEFASVTNTADADATEDAATQNNVKIAQIDEKLRAEAATEMEKAIASCDARVSKEESALASLDPARQAEQKRSIADVRDMMADMRQRLIDLRNPATSLSGIAATGPAGAAGATPDGSDPLRGVLGAILGESKAEQKKRIEEATKNANDLSSLVKHKKKQPQPQPKPPQDSPPLGGDAANGKGKGKGKRKADVDTESVGSGKKVKFLEDAVKKTL